MSKIGVFDSGIGGQAMANAIQKAMPDATLVTISDTEHMPYGDKTPQQILGYIIPILHDMVNQGCDAIVIACNTATTTLIQQLRQAIAVPLVGIEPMVKPAAEQTKTGIVAVCATPLTLASERYAWLKQTYAPRVTVLEPDCSKWAYMIEHNQIEDDFIARQIDGVCDAGADVIVLGCTHYHWIEEKVRAITAGRARVIQPEQAVIRQLQQILERS